MSKTLLGAWFSGGVVKARVEDDETYENQVFEAGTVNGLRRMLDEACVSISVYDEVVDPDGEREPERFIKYWPNMM